MNERRVHIDEFFRRQMEGHTDAPPAAVWEALEKRLDEKPGRKRPFPIWWFWTIAGLAIISASVIIAGYIKDVSKPVAVNTAPTLSNAVTPAANGIVPHRVTPTATHQQDNKTVPQADNNDNKTHNTSRNNTKTLATNNKATNSPATQEEPLNNNDTRKKTQEKPAQAENNNAAATGNATSVANAPTTPGNMKDNLFFLSSALQGVELPIHIPMAAPRNKVTLPIASSQPKEKDDALVSRQVAATDMPAVTAPGLQVAFAGPLQASSSLPVLLAPDDEHTGTAQAEILPQASLPVPADTSKKKKLLFPDSTTPPGGETVYPVDTKKKKPLPIDIGFKLGYAKGFDKTWYADKYILSPYFEYRLPAGFSLTVQPSFLFGKARVGALTNSDQYFHEVISNSFTVNSRLARGAIDSSVLTPNPPDTIFRTYKYGQVYDSIHVGYRMSNAQLWDVELPVIAKYRINKTFSVLLGGSVAYSSVLQTKEEVNRYDGLKRDYTEVHTPQTFYVTYQGQEPPPGPAPQQHSALFPYNTAPFSNYQPRQITTNKNFFRYGFMVGVSANITDRWIVELMLHKTGVDAGAVPDKQLQKIYSQPYLRFMLGYKLTK